MNKKSSKKSSIKSSKKNNKDNDNIDNLNKDDSKVIDDDETKENNTLDDTIKDDNIINNFVMKIEGNYNLLKNTENITVSNNINYPEFKNGFQWYYHANRKKMDDQIKKFDGKKKVYRIINKVETTIDEYNDSIDILSIKYFDLKNNETIINRSFYKLWEILFSFNLINLSDDNFVSIHIGESACSFLQATLYFRNMFSKKEVSKNDKHILTKLDNKITLKYMYSVDEKFIKMFDNNKKIQINKTQIKNNTKANFITADGGIFVNRYTQETDMLPLLLIQIIEAINLQEKGGNFVCKFYETFTSPSIKLIVILKEMYEHVYFIKPTFSRTANNEKYIVCINFKYNNKDAFYNQTIEKLNNLTQAIINNEHNIVDIFSKFKISNELQSQIIYMNTIIANEQFKNINEIDTFIIEQNYYGELYHLNKNRQINISNQWKNIFFPSDNNYKKSSSIAKENIKNTLDNNKNKLIHII
jgi:23S rRNA U2552 (ribose-2'-O)-methylase RlmE/FtsJ